MSHFQSGVQTWIRLRFPVTSAALSRSKPYSLGESQRPRHAFCRFRAETLRRVRVPEDLIKLWPGHSKQTVTDFYAGGLEKDETWRQEWCEKAGLGFDLDCDGRQNVTQVGTVQAA